MSITPKPLDTNIELTDGVVLLRPPRSEDAPALVQAVQSSLAELHPWVDWASAAYDEAAARRWLQFAQLAWQHGTAFHFAVCDAHTGEYMGSCGLDGLDPKQRIANLGYWVRSNRTGQGVASRAAQLAIGFGFARLRLARIEIVVAVANQASRRVAEKTGAHFEGIVKERVVVHTQVHDAAVYVAGVNELTKSC